MICFRAIFLVFNYLDFFEYRSFESEPDADLSDTFFRPNETSSNNISSMSSSQNKESKKCRETFEIDFPFSIMDTFSSRPIGYINKETMNEKQKAAFTRLRNYLSQIVLNKFNHKTSINRFYKSKIAYRIESRCTKQACIFTWTSNFNIQSQKASVSYNGTICDHFIDSKGKQSFK